MILLEGEGKQLGGLEGGKRRATLTLVTAALGAAGAGPPRHREDCHEGDLCSFAMLPLCLSLVLALLQWICLCLCRG